MTFVASVIFAVFSIASLQGGGAAAVSASPEQRPTVFVVMAEKRAEYELALTGMREIFQGEVEDFDLARDPERVQAFITRVTTYQPDLIVTFGSPAYRIIRARAGSVPVMFSMVAYPHKLCAAHEEPWGIALEVDSGSVATYLAALSRDEIPAGSRCRVGVIYNPELSSGMIERLILAGPELGIEFVTCAVHSKKESLRSIEDLVRKVDLFFLIPDPLMAGGKVFDRLRLECFRHHRPIVGFSRQYLSMGCAACIGPDYRSIGRSTGEEANAFLENPGTARSGIVYPSRAETMIDRDVATRLQFKIPEDLESRLPPWLKLE